VLKILLVEDNPADVALTRNALRGFCSGVELYTAHDGEFALQMLSQPDFKPDLIILDLNLPRVDGHTVLQRFHRTDIPVVVFSSSGDQGEIQRALSLGARDCVRKPIGLQPFTDAVCGIVSRWLPHQATSTA
jgi:CheY-like chemotaxis protein